MDPKMHACTTSYIAKNLKIKKNGNNLVFTFENRHANVALKPGLLIEKRLTDAAVTAANQLFYSDVLGALLTLRLHGEKFD
jgi:hypothetical protein